MAQVTDSQSKLWCPRKALGGWQPVEVWSASMAENRNKSRNSSLLCNRFTTDKITVMGWIALPQLHHQMPRLPTPNPAPGMSYIRGLFYFKYLHSIGKISLCIPEMTTFLACWFSYTTICISFHSCCILFHSFKKKHHATAILDG